MKKKFMFGLLLFVMTIGGCGGVWMNAEYSMLLDQTAALSAETATRAETGLMPEAQMIQALTAQSQTWEQFQNARDGVEGGK